MSSTYSAAIVAFLTLVLPVIGIEVVDSETLLGTIAPILGALAVLYVPYGRYRAGGINALGLRKKTD